MPSFELITQHGRPIAALVPRDVNDQQLAIIRGLLPEQSFFQQPLSVRWSAGRVISTNDWACDQLRRIPMTRPKQTIKLAFL